MISQLSLLLAVSDVGEEVREARYNMIKPQNGKLIFANEKILSELSSGITDHKKLRELYRPKAAEAASSVMFEFLQHLVNYEEGFYFRWLTKRFAKYNQ